MQTKNREITYGCNLKDIHPVSVNECNSKNDDHFIDAMRYCYNDILTVEKYIASMDDIKVDIPGMIDRVIFNDPATIILWKDGSKTIVKRSDDDIWDPEKGFCMAIIKKLYGHTSFIKKFMEPDKEMPILTIEKACEDLKNFGKKLKDAMDKGGKK
jgi:hypothetical protein